MCVASLETSWLFEDRRDVNHTGVVPTFKALRTLRSHAAVQVCRAVREKAGDLNGNVGRE